MRWFKRWRKRFRAVVEKDAVDRELDEELAFHLEMETEKNIREGMSPKEARRQAAIKFGGVERYKEKVREARTLGWVTGILVDFKLGARMLVKYPWITVTGGLALAICICVGSATFEILSVFSQPDLKLEDGERIVGIRVVDRSAGRWDYPLAWDLDRWRGNLESIEELGGFRWLPGNLFTDGPGGAPVRVTEISPTAFAVARVPPLLGRGLVFGDDRMGAPLVMVIGYDLWQGRFGGDPEVVGTTVRLNAESWTVVGVMPEGFHFPMSDDLWVPLRLDRPAYPVSDGPQVAVFGRLAPGIPLDQAQAEVSALGLDRMNGPATDRPRVRPLVVPHARSMMGPSLRLFQPEVLATVLGFIALIALLCSNVALLIFARVLTREGELVVRTALGAPRFRIVGQLFSEALVLGAAAGVIGLTATYIGLHWVFHESGILGDPLPFWFRASLSPSTLLFATCLIVLQALFVGVWPGLKATRGLAKDLKRRTPGGGGYQFGRFWTVVIVIQIALTIPLPTLLAVLAKEKALKRQISIENPMEQYLTARLELGLIPSSDPEVVGEEQERRTADAFSTRYSATLLELERRLSREPAVAGISFIDHLPRVWHPWSWIEVDQDMVEPPDGIGHRVASASIDESYFDLLGAPVLSGRNFESGDLASSAPVVIVDEPFVDRVLGGRDAVGLRLRYVATLDSPEPTAGGPWYEIIGVVGELGMHGAHVLGGGIYHPTARAGTYPVHIIVHLRNQAALFLPRFQEVAASIDPALRLNSPLNLDQVADAELQEYEYGFWTLLVLALIGLLLSLAGIYSVMSFSVSQRTREIGIRVALGGNWLRILTTTLRLPLLQVGLGLLLGGLLSHGFASLVSADLAQQGFAGTQVYAGIMAGACLLGCVGPARKALRVEPTDALRVDQ